MVNLASELYYATLDMYQGADDATGTATALAALLLDNIVKVGRAFIVTIPNLCLVAFSDCVV